MTNLKKLIEFLPIQQGEFRKFFTTSFMMVLTLYVYCIQRGAKDALIVSELGAELISTIKLYGVLPMAILFMLVYTKLVDFFTRIQTYHILNGFFITFFGLFAFVLYPNIEHLTFDFSGLEEKIPYLKYVFVMIAYWPYTLFYIMSELWGSMMLALMFWQLANQITTVVEAKRFYPLFGLFGQLGMIISGILLGVFTSKNFITDGWMESIKYIALSDVAAGGLLSLALWYLSNHIVDKEIINGEAKKKKKKKMGFFASLKHIFSSRYVGLIALLILCYGISINLVEGVWKKHLGIMFPDAVDYGSFMGELQIWTGIATAIAMLSGSYILRLISWRTAAILTPIAILVTGACFFLFIIFKAELEPYVLVLGATALSVSVYSGGLQNVLSKAIKYSFFDPTKEMAYIPLDETLKSKGKAAADVIGGRLGKSGGAIIQWMMLSFIAGSTLVSLASNLFIIFLVVMVIWLFAVFALSKEFEKKTKEMDDK